MDFYFGGNNYHGRVREPLRLDEDLAAALYVCVECDGSEDLACVLAVPSTSLRDSLEKLRQLSVLTDRGAQIRLGDVAAIQINDGPPMLKSENARLSGWVYIDIRGRDLSSAVRDMHQPVAKEVKLPAGYSKGGKVVKG